MNTETLSLEKIWIEKTAYEFAADGNDHPSAAKSLTDLKKELEKATKQGWKKLRLDTKDYEGDHFTLPRSSIAIVGYRIETEHEWHTRLEHQKNQYKREIEKAKQTIQNCGWSEKRIDDLDKALTINGFVVPEFDRQPKQAKAKEEYYWWSWHPCYPYWSKSCWGGGTIEEAKEQYKKQKSSFDCYANKLVKEHNGTFEVIETIEPVVTTGWVERCCHGVQKTQHCKMCEQAIEFKSILKP